MKKEKGILIGAIVLIVVLLLTVLSLATGLTIGKSASGSDSKKVECSGTINVPLIGKSSLKDVQCRTDACSGLPFSLFSDSGNLKLYVNGQLKSSRGWSSTLNADQTFTIKSACVENPTTASLILYNENNEVLNKFESDLQ